MHISAKITKFASKSKYYYSMKDLTKMEENKNKTNVSQGTTQLLIRDLRQIIEQARGHVAATERWSKRTLQANIDGMLFERTAIAAKPDELVKKELSTLDGLKGQQAVSPGQRPGSTAHVSSKIAL